MIEKALIIYIIIINAVGFAMMGIDKRTAQLNGFAGEKNKKKKTAKYRRIPEKCLLATAFLLGGAGSFIGMRVFHHKTQKPKFYIGVPLIIVLNVAFVLMIYTLL